MSATTKESVFVDDDFFYSREELENWDYDAQPFGYIKTPSKTFSEKPFVGSCDDGRAQVFFFYLY